LGHFSLGIATSILQLLCCLQSITVEMLPDVMGRTPCIRPTLFVGQTRKMMASAGNTLVEGYHLNDRASGN